MAPDQRTQFRRAYFGPIDLYLAWHDSFTADTAGLAALPAAGQAEAAHELLAALRRGQADARAIIGLGFLRCEEALPLLHDYLRRGTYALYALQAIAAISPAGLYQPLVAQSLQPTRPWTQLIDVLVGLRELPGLLPAAEVVAALLALLTHREFLVRHHTLATLRQLLHLPTPAFPAPDPIATLLASRWWPCRHRQARRRLLTQLAGAR